MLVGNFSLEMSSYSRDQSSRLRSTGNEIYAKSLKEGLAPNLRQCLLRDAIPYYQRALTAASPNHKDLMASACKNLAKTNETLFKMSETEEKEQYHLRESFHFYSKATEYGKGCMEMQWLADMDTRLRLLFEGILDRFEFIQSSKKKVVLFESLAALVTETCVVYPDINNFLAEILLNEACTALSNKDFKPSLHALKEMYRPMEELKRYGKQRPDLSSKLEYFENEASTQTARTESLQAIDTGNEFKMIIFNFQGRSKIPLIRAVIIFFIYVFDPGIFCCTYDFKA